MIEVDAVTRRILWSYPRSAAPGLFCDRFRTAQRLENGNTLMTSSELGVALLDVQRYPRDYVASWLGVAD